MRAAPSSPPPASVPDFQAVAASLDAALSCEIAGLPELDLQDLRSRWRQRLRCPPPPNLTQPLLLRLLAYRLQAKALGDLDPDSARFLDKIARDKARQRRTAERRKAKAVPIVPPVPPVRGLKPGTLLVREHAGTLHRVTVVVEGFTWNGARNSVLTISKIDHGPGFIDML